MDESEMPMPRNPSRPPPLYWGVVTIIKRGDPRRGKVGTITKRYPEKTPDGQWIYDVKFEDDSLEQYLHDDLYMGRV